MSPGWAQALFGAVGVGLQPTQGNCQSRQAHLSLLLLSWVGGGSGYTCMPRTPAMRGEQVVGTMVTEGAVSAHASAMRRRRAAGRVSSRASQEGEGDNQRVHLRNLVLLTSACTLQHIHVQVGQIGRMQALDAHIRSAQPGQSHRVAHTVRRTNAQEQPGRPHRVCGAPTWRTARGLAATWRASHLLSSPSGSCRLMFPCLRLYQAIHIHISMKP